jgi:hypothetical protein
MKPGTAGRKCNGQRRSTGAKSGAREHIVLDDFIVRASHSVTEDQIPRKPEHQSITTTETVDEERADDASWGAMAPRSGRYSVVLRMSS